MYQKLPYDTMKYHKIAKPYFKHIHKISKTYLKHIQNTFKIHINTQHIPPISHVLVVSSRCYTPLCYPVVLPRCVTPLGGFGLFRRARCGCPAVVAPLCIPLCQPPLEDGAENNFTCLNMHIIAHLFAS